MTFMPTAKTFFAWIARSAVIGAAILCAGCPNREIGDIEDLQSVSLYSRTDQLPRTMQYIESIDRYDTSEFEDKVSAGLNRWVSTLPPDDINWTLDPLIESLPESIRTSTLVDDLDGEFFAPSDAHYIQVCAWAKTLAHDISRPSPASAPNFLVYIQAATAGLNEAERSQLSRADDTLAAALETLDPRLREEAPGGSGPTAATKLAQTLRLFDWVIRNVQLADAPPRVQPADFDQHGLVEDGVTDWPADWGIVGPGYKRFPWQVLLYGRGDGLERARLFILLARQLDLDVAMLAVPPAGDSSAKGEVVEWLPAALIAGHWYLFDTQLGLPIETEQPGTIATLADVQARPELLRALDLTVEESVDKMVYPVTAEQLPGVVALIDAAPEALSARMRRLEDHLVGSQQLKLTVDASAMAERIRGVDGVTDVRLWRVPFDTPRFRERLGEGILAAEYDEELRDRVVWVATDEQYVDRFVAFRTARNLYFHRLFETDRNDAAPNAVSDFFKFIYTDDEIHDIETNLPLQSALKLFRRAGQPYAEWKAGLEGLKQQMYLIRADAAYFLALSNYELGLASTCLNWLDRAEMFDSRGHWAPAIGYLQARCHETLARFDEAIAELRATPGPQRHGNLLRARRLAQRGAVANDTAAPEHPHP